jgi:peptidoglycan/xylan/chitin deacetylase (PgdA/CDA1 family)
MALKVLAIHHVSARPALPLGPDVDSRITPQRLREIFQQHHDWEFVDPRRAFAPGANRSRSLLLTFDDGYADLLMEALPILEEFDAPCVAFIVTGWVDGTVRPMESDLAWIASHLPGEAGQRLYRRAARRYRRRSPPRREAALRRLAARQGLPWPPPPRDLLLCWDRIAALAAHPLVTIGSHTVSHPLMRPFHGGLALREATESRERIEAVLGRPIECFAYPYGRHGAAARSAVSRAGYHLAFTTTARLIEGPRDLDPMAVPRFVVEAGIGGSSSAHPADPAPAIAGRPRAAA